MTAGNLQTDDMRDLYRDLILDHARNPRHFGRLEHATHSAQGINPLCGDKLRLYLDLDADATIRDAAFEGSGCAISVASASLLTDTVIGLNSADAIAFFDAVTAQLAGKELQHGKQADIGKLRALEGVRDYPSRVKCATLAWHALRSALQQDTAPATTE
jgi:nitrogen fixation protein NifU and related proteins